MIHHLHRQTAKDIYNLKMTSGQLCVVLYFVVDNIVQSTGWIIQSLVSFLYTSFSQYIHTHVCSWKNNDDTIQRIGNFLLFTIRLWTFHRLFINIDKGQWTRKLRRELTRDIAFVRWANYVWIFYATVHIHIDTHKYTHAQL